LASLLEDFAVQLRQVRHEIARGLRSLCF
jgi:hypothetical protein